MWTDRLKIGDTLPNLLRHLQRGGSDFDVSSADYNILVSGEDVAAPGTALYSRRDVTSLAKANGTPAEGKIAIPIFDGRGTAGTLGTATVVNNAADGKINVTIAASGGSGGTIYQELYRTTAGGATYYRILGPFADGLYSASPYLDNTADSALTAYRQINSTDQSATNTYSALPTGPTPTCALAGVGAGSLSNGVYNYKVVNSRAADTATARTIQWEIIVQQVSTGRDVTFPDNGFDYLEISDDV